MWIELLAAGTLSLLGALVAIWRGRADTKNQLELLQQRTEASHLAIIDAYRAQVEEAQRSTHTQVTALTNANDTLAKQVQAQEVRIAEFRGAVNLLSNQNETYATRLAVLELSRTQNIKRIEDMQAKIDSLTEQLTVTKTTLANATAFNERLQTNLQTAETELKAARAALARAQADLSAASRQIEALQAQPARGALPDSGILTVDESMKEGAP
jgi:chromosome segregation ATPase